MSRDLRFFFLFRLLATSYLYVPIFVFFKLARGLGFNEVMLLSAVYAGVVILLEVPTGALADRLGRRTSLMAGSLSMVLSCLVAFKAGSFSAFAIAEGLAAVSIALCSGADSAYLHDLLHGQGKGELYIRAEGTSSAWHLSGNALAYIAGGSLAMVDLALPYAMTAVTSALAFCVALCLREPRRSVRSEATTVQRFRSYGVLMVGALRTVLTSRRLLWLMGFSALAFTLLVVTKYIYQPYLGARGFSFFQTGMVFAGLNLFAACVASQMHRLRDRLGDRALLFGLLGGLSLSFLLLNQFEAAWLFLGLLAVQAASTGLFSPLVKPLINREILDSGQRATVLSVESIARRVAVGALHPAIGLLSLTAGIYACGLVGLAGMFFLLAMWPGRRGERLWMRGPEHLGTCKERFVDRSQLPAQTANLCPRVETTLVGNEFTSSPSVVRKTGSTRR